MRLAVIDYRINNIGSLVRSLQLCGYDPAIATRGEDLAHADKIIVPGVGAFGDGMQKLAEYNFIDPLRQAALHDKKAILGICLGMQLFAARGFEGGDHKGLGFFNYNVEQLNPSKEERLPHIGWNALIQKKNSKLLTGIPDGGDFYFVHSYGIRSINQNPYCTATVDYAGGFAAVMEQENIFGVQFHPEKSFPLGFDVLKNFLRL